MERRENVTARSVTTVLSALHTQVTREETMADISDGDWIAPGEDPLPIESPQTGPAQAPGVGQEHGFCLYLGPRGQRCRRPAIQSGFCRLHQPGGFPRAVRDRKRILAAALALAAILWPYLHDVLAEILRWINTR